MIAPDELDREEPVALGPAEREQRLNHLIRTYRPALLPFAGRLAGGDHALAEDIVQETFLRAWLRIDRLTPEHGSVASWLHRVAYNVAIDGYRMRRVRPTEVELLHQELPTGHTVPDLTHQILAEMVVHDLLEEIWPEHRAVLEEVYLQDRSTAEAARRLGIPVGTVKSRLYYALRTLRGNASRMGLQAS